MKTNNIIYSFFIIIAMLFWNPISFYIFYSDTLIYSEMAIHIFYWLIFLSGILMVVLIHKNKFSERIKNIALTITLMGILFFAFVIIDRAVGLVSKDEAPQVQKQEWLVFEPNSKARYQTVEFDFIAYINSLGLRDIEIQIDKGDKYRILCFGDSWTFGWGVNAENSWPKILEQYLFANGYENIEVINCGYPGQYTSTYKKNMEKIVPLLDPDLVLVGVLQLDDLAQIYENNFLIKQANTTKTFARNVKSITLKYMKYSFRNVLSSQKMVEIKSNWKRTSTSMMADFNHLQKIRFYTLNDSVKSLFKNGDLNPGLVNYYLNFTDKEIIFNNQNHPATKFSIQEMNKDIKEMRDICYKYNSKLIFINLPSNDFTGHIVIRTPSDSLNPYFEANNNIDPIYRSVANTNHLPYVELTEHFIG